MNKGLKFTSLLLLGLTCLWFFPEPQTYFILYTMTMLMFIVVLIIVWKENDDDED